MFKLNKVQGKVLDLFDLSLNFSAKLVMKLNAAYKPYYV